MCSVIYLYVFLEISNEAERAYNIYARVLDYQLAAV